MVLPVAPHISGEDLVPFSAFLANYSPVGSLRIFQVRYGALSAQIFQAICVYPNALLVHELKCARQPLSTSPYPHYCKYVITMIVGSAHTLTV